MPTKNEALIARARSALTDQDFSDACMIPLITGLIAALEATATPVTKPRRKTPVSLMMPLSAGDEKPCTAVVLDDARVHMDANPLPCIANATVRGDRATFKVKDIVCDCDERGFTIAEDVGYGSIDCIAKVIMLHVTRRFGVAYARLEESGSREGGLNVEFDREIPEDGMNTYYAFLGQE